MIIRQASYLSPQRTFRAHQTPREFSHEIHYSNIFGYLSTKIKDFYAIFSDYCTKNRANCFFARFLYSLYCLRINRRRSRIFQSSATEQATVFEFFRYLLRFYGFASSGIAAHAIANDPYPIWHETESESAPIPTSNSGNCSATSFCHSSASSALPE